MNRILFVLLSVIIVLISTIVGGCTGNFVKEATSTELYSGTVEVSGFGTYAIHCNLHAGNEVSVDVQSGHGIDFYILDEDNYNKFTNKENFLYEDMEQSIVQQNGISFTAPRDGNYYFTMSNRDHLSATQVYIKISQVNL